MKSLLRQLVQLLPLLPLAAAQSNYPSQSAPFTLRITSDNATLDNTYLVACHSGAAIEQLCLSSASVPPSAASGTFYLNSSISQATQDPTGILTWNLPLGGGAGVPSSVSEPLAFVYSPTSNVAVLVLQPTTTDLVPLGFTATEDGDIAKDSLFVYTYQDDTTVPPSSTGAQPRKVFQWYACTTYYASYKYLALAWVTAGEPINPTCEPVSVTRVFL